MDGMHGPAPSNTTREGCNTATVYCRYCGKEIEVRQTADGKGVIGLHPCPKSPELFSVLLSKAEERIKALEAEVERLGAIKLNRCRGKGANYKVPVGAEHETLLWYLVRAGITTPKRAVPMRELVRMVNAGGDRKQNGRQWEPNASTSGRLSELIPWNYVCLVDKRVMFDKEGLDVERFVAVDSGEEQRKWRNKPLWYAAPDGVEYIRAKYDAGKERAGPDERRDVI